MNLAIEISEDLIPAIHTQAARSNRTVNGQADYWLRIGKLAEDNPDLPLSFLKDIWQALQEVESQPVKHWRKPSNPLSSASAFEELRQICGEENYELEVPPRLDRPNAFLVDSVRILNYH